MFENLFRNAVEHGGQGVTIWVGTTDDGVYVEDDGPGIPASQREKLQANEAGAEASIDGIGLAIVRAIVTAHDWSFSLEEGREGGTRVEITGIDFLEAT
ncbi:hypothetical protein BB347_11870 [Natronorubrum daqingense]|uniref:histidine kinase n=1 Tax=Natronorubrum daqingense TaxID=588898 RepID=A0A1P8RF47_9EURY|nr:hypothetical protein BB347_11870 [Natronorubrum daqingense]